MRELAAALSDVPGLRTEVVASAPFGRPPIVAKCLVEVDSKRVGLTAPQLADQLQQGEPPVWTGRYASGLVVSPMCLQSDDLPVIARRIREIATHRR